ncbi:MAG: butyrate kinase, partial [Firmicutes bacterium]|nr:butyrate kinase [Bacillota bacterium]
MGNDRTYRILVINPGSTSTKVAVYENEIELFSENAVHSQEALQEYGNNIILQMPLRTKVIQAILEDNEIELESLDAVVGRGGMIPGLKTGGYYADEALCRVVKEGALIPHASNLGALIAREIAEPLGIPALIYDAVSAADLPELAQITGIDHIRRQSYCHVLNSRAMAHEYAKQQG